MPPRPPDARDRLRPAPDLFAYRAEDDREVPDRVDPERLPPERLDAEPVRPEAP